METCAASSRRTDSPCLVAAGCSSAVLRTQCRIHVRGAYARMLHAVTTHEQREQRGCSWKSRRAALSTEPPHLRRRKTAVGSAGPSPHRSACGTVRSDCLAGWRHASSSNGEGSDIRFFTAAQPEGTCMPPNEDLGLPAPPSASRRVADRI